MDDVAIAGGGPAGSLAAIALARAGFRVRVFERARFPRHKLCGDTLNPGACRALAPVVPLEAIVERARPIDGMLLTGPGGVRVRARYGAGLVGYAIERRLLDAWLLDRAIASGARVEQEAAVTGVVGFGEGVSGVRVRTRGGTVEHRARLVIAADGRHSRLAFAAGLARHPVRPRRWAIGAYFEDVEGLSDAGEMHVRRAHYIGVAAMPGGLANACLVVPHVAGAAGWRDAAALLRTRLADDPLLGPRFARARAIGAPVVLGPMAVDVEAPGVAGMLFCGDAAGFIDPMTGDGLTFALRGALLAAGVATEVLAGRRSRADAVAVLARRRRAAFASKWRFNRVLRHLVSSPGAVGGAAIAARLVPAAFERMIQYAGDATFVSDCHERGRPFLSVVSDCHERGRPF